MKLHEYSRLRSFFDLGPRSFRYKNFNMFFLETTGPFVTKWKAFTNKEIKINKYDFGRMTNMAAMPVYGKIILKKDFSGTSGLTALKLGMEYWGLGAHRSLFK